MQISILNVLPNDAIDIISNAVPTPPTTPIHNLINSAITKSIPQKIWLWNSYIYTIKSGCSQLIYYNI